MVISCVYGLSLTQHYTVHHWIFHQLWSNIIIIQIMMRRRSSRIREGGGEKEEEEETEEEEERKGERRRRRRRRRKRSMREREKRRRRKIKYIEEREREIVGWLLVCLTSQQLASVSQGWICTDNYKALHTEIEDEHQTCSLTQSQYIDTGLTSPSTEPITPGDWQGSHWSANF